MRKGRMKTCSFLVIAKVMMRAIPNARTLQQTRQVRSSTSWRKASTPNRTTILMLFAFCLRENQVVG